MKISQQIRARREQLGASVSELAKRVGVSAQAVRHWESGRSFPGKSKAPLVEAALSFTIDWTEGRRAESVGPQMAALVEKGDVDLLMLLGRLPEPYKNLMSEMAKMHLAAITGERRSFSSRATQKSVPSFSDREAGASRAIAKSGSKGHRVQKKAAR